MTRQVSDYYDSQNYAAARGEYMYVNGAAVDEIKTKHGVTDAAGYNTFYTKTRVDGIRFDMTVTTLTSGIDEPYIIEGALPAADKNEMIVDSVFADAHGINIGDTFDFSISTLKKISLEFSDTVRYTPEYVNVDYSYTVSGIYHSPDIIYKVNTLNTAARPEEFVFAQVNFGQINPFTADAYIEAPAFGMTHVIPQSVDVDVFNGIKVTGEVEDVESLFEDYTVKDAAQLLDIMNNPKDPAGLYMYSLERKNFPAVTAFDSMNDTIAALAAVLPMIFFAVAAAITVISLSKTVENQRMQIGVIQALGVGKSKVYFSYIFYALFACVVGGLAGGLTGTYFVPWLLGLIYSRQFCMPPTPQIIGVEYMFLGVVISAALACLSAFISCHRTLRVVPAQAMRPKPPKKTRRILVERWTKLWKKLGFGAKMNLRNMFLHKIRMLLSSVGIVGCLALLVGLIGLKDNMAMSFTSYDGSTGYDMTIITDIAVDLTDENVYAHIDGAEGEEYMHNLTFVPDFASKLEFDGKTVDTTLMALPTYEDEKHYRYADADCIRLYTDRGGHDRVLFEADTFVIPEMIADKLGAGAGDTVKVSGYTLDNRSVSFEVKITAVVKEYFDQKAYCSYATFENNGVGLYADTSYATILPGVDLDDALAALAKNDVVRDVKTLSETFEALEKQMSLLDYAVILFVVGAAALAVAVIYNITATNLKERTREIATLMVLGYKKNETANMIIVENIVITAIGCVLGLPLGYGLLIWLVDITRSFNVFISAVLSWYVALGCIALTFVFSILATLLLNTKMKKISMVEALKSVE